MRNIIFNLLKKWFLKKHRFTTGILIHRKNGHIIFETEFNWYDETLQPVTLVREVRSNKIFSIRGDEMLEFKEYSGSDPNAEFIM